MKGGILEVLLVSAEGIRHTNLIGKPAYYVIIECGTQVHRSKTSADNHEEICWNEKFTFEFPPSEWETLTQLKLKIMDEEYFTNGGFVGETRVYLEGIVLEGNARGFIELRPAPYNVLLEDDTYKGEIKIGLKFIPNGVVLAERGEYAAEEKELGQSVYRTIINLWKIPWWRFLTFYRNTNSGDKQKEK